MNKYIHFDKWSISSFLMNIIYQFICSYSSSTLNTWPSHPRWHGGGCKEEGEVQEEKEEEIVNSQLPGAF